MGGLDEGGTTGRERAAQAPKRSQLDQLLEPSSFVWATGIEDTFVFDPDKKTGRILDEYELTQHYERRSQDLELMGTLGVSMARYGVPWYRIQPEKGRWDWEFADAALNHLLDLGIHPIVDLVHYGTPDWVEGAFLNPDFPKYMTEYAVKVAERYRDQIWWYTPLNEPRITAHYCGRIGWWPPYHKGWKGFMAILKACCRGIMEVEHALRLVDPEIVTMHVDAMDTYETRIEELRDKASFNQSLVCLPMDLITGRICDSHELLEWCQEIGLTNEDVEWFFRNRVMPDLIGLNMYPMFSRRELVPSGKSVRYAARYGTRDMVKFLGRTYFNRYGKPLMISETAATGSHERRNRWIHESLSGVRELRAEGVPMVGYTWWPMFSLIGWAYRQQKGPLSQYIVPMGLWDLDSKSLDRVDTSVVGTYRHVVSCGSVHVGTLNSKEELNYVS